MAAKGVVRETSISKEKSHDNFEGSAFRLFCMSKTKENGNLNL